GETHAVIGNPCPPPGSPFTTENLGHACESAGLRWRAYCEDLPAVGSDTCSFEGTLSSGLYTRKHCPWTDWDNLDHRNERPYRDLATDIASDSLPALAFVIPNNCHNTHNKGVPGCGVPEGDAWLASQLPALIQALGPRGILILTWDEDDNNAANHILTVFRGALVKRGHSSKRTVNHYTVLRTICDALGLAPFGPARA